MAISDAFRRDIGLAGNNYHDILQFHTERLLGPQQYLFRLKFRPVY